MGELESSIGPQELLHWQIYFNQEYWRNRVKNETSEGKSQALMSLIMGKNG